MLRPKILLVATTRTAFADLPEVLESQNMATTFQAEGWEAALKIAEKERPHLILADLQLTQLENSKEYLRTLIQPGGAGLVCFSPRGSQPSTDPSMAPADAYILLPSPPSDIKAALTFALARQQTVDETLHPTMAVISTDLLGRVQFLNATASRLTGWTLNEANGKPLKEIMNLTDAGPSLESILEARIPRSTPLTAMTLTHKAGSQTLVYDLRAPLRDAQGGLIGMVVLLREKPISLRLTAASLLSATLESEETSATVVPLPYAKPPRSAWPDLSVMMQSIADPMFSVEADWSISYVNQPAAELLESATREALLGKPIWSHLPKSVYHSHFHEFSQAMSRKLPRTFELFLAASDKFVEVQLYPYGEGLLGLMRDITARKQAEEQERRMEKLESLGLLARGFAHDFNNLLTVQLGNLSLAEELLPRQIEGREEVVTARRATQQAQGLVQHLLTFARGGAPLKQSTDLAKTLAEWTQEWPAADDVEYVYDISATPCLADVDRQQIHRLFHNLMRNAEQATVKGGKLCIRLLPATSLGKMPASLPIQPRDMANWIILQIVDEGSGIAEENLAKVFEPYFTTKHDANASGLGLTVCESIIKSHGAILSLQSRLGKGTVATVAIPRLAGALTVLHSPTVPHQHPDTKPQKPRVLLLEDELLIRRLSVAHLKSMGCEVVETADGSETLTVYEEAMQRGCPFDLVIMDLSIPGGMGGVQTMELLRQLDPNVVAIVSSGYSDDPVMHRFLDYGFQARLPKPYRPEELKQLVEQHVTRATRE